MALTFLPFLFPGVPHVRCAFQCRGLTPPPAVSAPDADYAGGNLSLDVNDDPESVRARRRALAAMLGVDDWVELRQVHGDALLFEPDPADPEQPSTLEADGAATSRPRRALMIKTADCQPILLADASGRHVAALHAGWRGTLAGVVPHTLQAMTRLYGTRPAEDLAACIGPGISAAAFEVGQEVADLFAGAGFPMADIAYTDASTGKPHIDLPAANRLQLLGSGLPPERICISGLCTYTRCDDFFSARRLGIKSGRMLSGIMWR